MPLGSLSSGSLFAIMGLVYMQDPSKGVPGMEKMSAFDYVKQILDARAKRGRAVTARCDDIAAKAVLVSSMADIASYDDELVEALDGARDLLDGIIERLAILNGYDSDKGSSEPAGGDQDSHEDADTEADANEAPAASKTAFAVPDALAKDDAAENKAVDETEGEIDADKALAQGEQPFVNDCPEIL